MLELRELEVARALLREAEVLAGLAASNPPRVARLRNLLAQPGFDSHSAWPDADGRDGRRSSIAVALSEEVEVAPPSRLLVLLGQALKWQQHTGQLAPHSALDLFRGAAPRLREAADAPPTGA